MPPVPQGGRRQNIDPAPARSPFNVSFQYGGQTRFAQFGSPQERRQYGWGEPGALSGGQDITRQFNQQFQPNAGIFSPSFPLVPVEPELARLWDFPVGYNYIWTPRSYEPISFDELRALANNENLTRMAIETRKDQIEKLEWSIRPRDEKHIARDAPQRIKQLTEFWRRPDQERPFASWLRELLEDMLVIDAPTLEILRNRDGSVRGYDIIDGSTIKVLIDITGRSPSAPAPAFEQVIHGRPWRLFTEDEIIYLPRNKRPGHVYGYSPVEQILMYINVALRRQTSQLYYFTEGNLPPGFLTVPELNADQIARLNEHMNDLLSGNLAERRRFQMIPYGAKWSAVKEAPLKDEFDEWLARVVMFCFSLPPDAFVRMRNRATSETARQTALEEGLSPLMTWVKRLVDDEIELRMGHKDLEFAWEDVKQIDPEIQNKVETQYVKLGIKTVDESREILGLDPLPNGVGSKPFVVAGNQILLVEDLEAASEKAIAPPLPPFTPGGGPQPSGGASQAPLRSATGRGGGATNGRSGANGPGVARHGTQRGETAANGQRVGGGRVGNAGQASARGAANGEPAAGAARKVGNGDYHSISSRAHPQYGVAGNGREALDREARQILRRHRAARIEADLRSLGA